MKFLLSTRYKKEDVMYCFGVDIGGTQVKIGLFKDSGELIYKCAISTGINNNEILSNTINRIEEISQQYHVEKHDLIGLGIGIPAPIAADGFVKKAANLGWFDFNVINEIKKLTDLQVVIGNDANLAALGEVWQGSGVGYDNAVFITIGTGIGSGIIINGKILTGEHGFGGEIGHICVNENETECCGCGRRGCLEQYSSAIGMTKLVKPIFANSEHNTMLDPSNVSAKNIFDAAKYGDFIADEVIEQASRYLAIALSNVAIVLDPEIFIIGGGVSQAGEILLNSIQYEYRKRAFYANKDAEFKLASLGNDAGIYGAAKLILDKKGDAYEVDQ